MLCALNIQTFHLLQSWIQLAKAWSRSNKTWQTDERPIELKNGYDWAGKWRNIESIRVEKTRILQPVLANCGTRRDRDLERLRFCKSSVSDSTFQRMRAFCKHIDIVIHSANNQRDAP